MWRRCGWFDAGVRGRFFHRRWLTTGRAIGRATAQQHSKQQGDQGQRGTHEKYSGQQRRAAVYRMPSALTAVKKPRILTTQIKPAENSAWPARNYCHNVAEFTGGETT